MEKSTTTPARKFKVGENVLVKTASKHFGWLSEMQERVGKQGVISEFYCEDEKINGEYGYRIGGWVWPESVLEKQFSPKPGDKIICNNGEELTCCTLEFLQGDALALSMKNDSIFAYQIAKESKIYHKNDWMCWKMDGSAYGQEWSIKEIIPAQQEVKQERTEETFTEFEIIRAYEDWNEGEAESLISIMKSNRKRVDPEYKLYLELKAKFEGKD